MNYQLSVSSFWLSVCNICKQGISTSFEYSIKYKVSSEIVIKVIWFSAFIQTFRFLQQADLFFQINLFFELF